MRLLSISLLVLVASTKALQVNRIHQKRLYAATSRIFSSKNHQSSKQNPKIQNLANKQIENETIDTSKLSTAGETSAHYSNQEFINLPVSSETRRAFTDVFKYKYLTNVQALSLPVIMNNTDCLARAKTGTGKTLAFLIPTVEKVVQSNYFSASKSGIPILVLSSSRELASQTAREAEQLLTFHNSNYNRVACFVGGTNINKDARQLPAPTASRDTKQIMVLVATPGRILDHLTNTPNFAALLGRLQCLVLDEADQLLDQGFADTLRQILVRLPAKTSRQTLLFSATISAAVLSISKDYLKTGYQFVDTLGSDASNGNSNGGTVTSAGSIRLDEENTTHEHVQQLAAVASVDKMVLAMMGVLQEEIQASVGSGQPYKIIVFFTTARLAGYMASLFQRFDLPVLEMHSRMSQSARNKASDAFRRGSNVLLFSSDVSARGLDYPDVTFVLQVGTTSKEQYIHRLGRTARAGKAGKGFILVHDFEEAYMLGQVLRDLPLQRADSGKFISSAKNQQILQQQLDLVRRASSGSGENTEDGLARSSEQAYQAWLGFYNSHLRSLRWTKEELVSRANSFAIDCCGLTKVPALQAKTIGKMGLRGVPGLVVEKAGQGQQGQGQSQGLRRNNNSNSNTNSSMNKNSSNHKPNNNTSNNKVYKRSNNNNKSSTR